VQIAGRPVVDDLSPARWVATALDGQPFGTVAGLVPPVFEAYARVFHPAVRYPDDELFGIDSDEPDQDVTWAEVAAFNGRTAHPAMEWASITGSWDFRGDDDQPGLWNDSPAEGHLPVSAGTPLAVVLARHTTTPSDCWFGVDNTWHPDAGPALHLTDVECVIVRGPIELAASNFAPEPVEQSANVWWPDDRAPWLPLLVLAGLGTVPWLVHAARVYRLNARDAGEAIGELTMGVDHHAVQGALAVALVLLACGAAVWPRGRRPLGVAAGICAGYVGLVSFAFPAAWAGFSPTWSVLGIVWGAAVAGLALAAPRSQPRELGGEVVETERAL